MPSGTERVDAYRNEAVTGYKQTFLWSLAETFRARLRSTRGNSISENQRRVFGVAVHRQHEFGWLSRRWRTRRASVRKRGGISSSITRSRTMCRKSIGNGRGGKGSGRSSGVSIPLPEPSLPSSTPAVRPSDETSGPIGVAAR
jgi:hypothetical protein